MSIKKERKMIFMFLEGWTKEEKETILKELMEEEMWEEQCALLETEFAGEEQCSTCQQGVRCELQHQNEGLCDWYQEIPYYD